MKSEFERSLDIRTGQQRHHDLDELAGVWSPEEAQEFDKVLAKQRPIDKELWQ